MIKNWSPTLSSYHISFSHLGSIEQRRTAHNYSEQLCDVGISQAKTCWAEYSLVSLATKLAKADPASLAPLDSIPINTEVTR